MGGWESEIRDYGSPETRNLPSTITRRPPWVLMRQLRPPADGPVTDRYLRGWSRVSAFSDADMSQKKNTARARIRNEEKNRES